MTSTNDGKDVKSNLTNNPKGKAYLIELYKSLEGRLNEECEASERTKHVCEAWRRVHSLCQHSAPSTHTHLINWLQRHTARTVLQTEWQTDKRKDDRKSLEEAIDDFISEVSSSGHQSSLWGLQLVSRGQWFKRILDKPWEHPVLTLLLNPSGSPPTHDEVLSWLKEERGVTFVVRLHTLVREKCDDIAVSLATAVMDRVREGLPAVADSEEQGILAEERSEPSFGDKLKEEAGFTPDVWETLTDIEFVLLHKRDSKRCIALAKRTPLLEAYPLIERLQKRLEASPREKRLWKNGREVAILIAQVVIARCMMVKNCANAARTALYCCSRLLAGLLAARLPGAADALAAQAPTARHLHTLAQAVDKQLSPTQESMKPYVCELYVRALTAGMNELERLKLKTEKQAEALSMEKTLASWFVQLGAVLSRSDRITCECILTAFSLHPSQKMYERIDAAPLLAPLTTDQDCKEEPITSEFGSWANDSRSQTNLVKTSETLNLKQMQSQANVLSTAIFNEGEALGLSPELCQDIAVLLSGPRVKTLSWDMDRTLLLENCRAYSEQTHGGTRTLTRELKYLNIDLKQYQHLPEEKDDDENDPYYGIEKGYEHLAVLEEPEDIWADDPGERTDTASSLEDDYPVPRRKKKTKRVPVSSDEDSNPLIVMAQAKRTQKKKERPHSKERSKERAKKKQEPVDPLDLNTESKEPTSEVPKEPKQKKERKKKEKVPKVMGGKRNPIARLLAERNKPKKIHKDFKMVFTPTTDSDYDSQGKNSVTSMNSEGKDHDTLDESSKERIPAPKFGLTIQKSVSHPTQRRPHNLSKMQYRPQTTIIRPNTPNALRPYSPIDPKTCSNQKKYTDEVRASIGRLLEIKRQRELQQNMMIKNTIQSPPRIPAIRHPDIPLQTNISPKTVAIPEIPKSYIKKEQIEQQYSEYMRAQKEEAFKNSVIQFAKKSSGNKSSASTSMAPKNKTQSNYKMTDIVNVSTPYDRLMAEISERHDRGQQLKTSQYNPQPVHSQMPAQKSYNITTPGQRDFQNFLKDYEQKKFMSARPIDMSSKPKEAKKPVMPVSRVVPVVPNAPKVEPKPVQSSKQPMQQKKPEASLNTFSRLSYMHKNKQNEMKNKALIQKPTCSTSTYQEVSSELDEIIKEHLLQQMRVIQAKRENADKFKAASPEPIKKNESASHPLLSNLLASPSKTNMSHYQNESLSKNNPVQPKLQGKSSSMQYPFPAKSTPVQQTLPVKSTAQQMLAAKSIESQTITGRSTPVHQTSTGLSIPMHHTYPGKSTSTQQTFPLKSTSGQQNITVKTEQKVISAKLNSSLSEKDQHDIMNLLWQQNKLKSSTPIQYSTNNNPQPTTSSITKSQSVNDCNANISQKQYSPSKPVMKETSIKSILETKIINVLSNTLLKPGPHEINKSLSLSVKPSDVKKPNCSSSQNEDKKYVISKHNKPETPEWQTVMQEILKHKTPCRGSKATNVTLEKTSFEKCSSGSALLRQNQPNDSTSSKSQDRADRPKPVITSIQNVIITKKGIKLQDTTNLHKNPTADPKNSKLKKTNSAETSKKLPQEVQRKQFTYAGPKQNDPFISGIPHSDYDLLEELMDDDLRKEIGELSSDEESYNEAAQSFLKSPKNKDKTRVSVQYNKSAISSVKPTDIDMQSKSRELNNDETREKESVSESVSQHGNETILCDSLQIRPAHIPHNNLTPTSHSAANQMSLTSNTENQAYALTSNQVLMNPSNIYISAVPQPTPVQNVVLVDSGMLYGGYPSVQTPIQTMNNMEHNAYVAVNSTPTMTLYQTAQYAAPVVISTPVAVPVINNILMQPNIINNMSQISGPPVIAEPLPSAEITESTETKDTYTETTKDAFTETTKDTYTETSDIDEESDSTQQIDQSQEDKSSERKVLSEVQDFILTEKIDNTSNHMIEENVPENVKKEVTDIERLKKKRLAIINREIYHQCLSRIIPLSYMPLPKTQSVVKEHDFTTAIPQSFSPLQSNEAVQKLLNNEEPKLPTKIKNGLQDLPDALDEVSSPATPDSTDSKENKNTPASSCRRILLRSSNKIKPKLNTARSVIETPVTKKSKGKLKSDLKEASTVTEKTNSDKVASKRKSKRLHSKKLTKNEEEKKTLEKKNLNLTTDQPLPKNKKKDITQSKNESFDMECLDIEAELQGSVITKSQGDMEMRSKKETSSESKQNNIYAPLNTTQTLLDIEKVPEPSNDFKTQDVVVSHKPITDKKANHDVLESVAEKTMNDNSIKEQMRKKKNLEQVRQKENENSEPSADKPIDDKIVQEHTGQEVNEKTKGSNDKTIDDNIFQEQISDNKTEDANKIVVDPVNEQVNDNKENETNEITPIGSESIICDDTVNDPIKKDLAKTCDEVDNFTCTSDKIDLKSQTEIEKDVLRTETKVENGSHKGVQSIPITTAKVLTRKENKLTRKLSVSTENAIIKDQNKDNVDLDMTVTCEEVPKLSPTFGSIRAARSKPINIEKVKNAKVNDDDKEIPENNEDSRGAASSFEPSSNEIAPIIETVCVNPTPQSWLKPQTNLNPKVIRTAVSTKHPKTLTKDSEATEDDVVIINDDVEVNPDKPIANINPNESKNKLNKPDSTTEKVKKGKTQPKTRLTSDGKVQRNTKKHETASDLSDLSKIPQDFKDKIRIESLPSNDPIKKTVRVCLPNGRKFKATLHGLSSTVGVQVTLDTLFTYPSIRSTLLNGLDCKKLFTMNIKQKAIVSKSDPNKILSAQILDIETSEHRKTTKPVETIDLLSDDEESNVSKNKPTCLPKNANENLIETAAPENQSIKSSPSDEEIRPENSFIVKNKTTETEACNEPVEPCPPIQIITPENVALKTKSIEICISHNISTKIVEFNQTTPVKAVDTIPFNNTSINTDRTIKTSLHEILPSEISLNIETGIQKKMPVEIDKPGENNLPATATTISKGRLKNVPVQVGANMDYNRHVSPISEIKPRIKIDSSKNLLKKLQPNTKQINSHVFDTEFGKFSVTSMKNDIFIKHQKKLNLKAQILLKKVDEKPDTPTKKVDLINLNESIPDQYVKDLINDIKLATEVKHAPTVIPDVVEIDDSSNDSLFQNQTVETFSEGNTINALKNVLLQELGVDVKPLDNKLCENLNNDDDDVVIVEEKVLSSPYLRKFLKLSDIPKGKSCTFVDLNDEEQLKIRKQKCSIKLERCDELVKKHKIDFITEEKKLTSANYDDEPVVIPEKMPIVESLDEKDHIMEVDERSSSPVIELFDVFVSMENKTLEKYKPAETEISALSCDATWFASKNMLHLQSLDSNLLIQIRNSNYSELIATDVNKRSNESMPLSCYASWLTTKSMLHLHNLANAQAKNIGRDLDISEDGLLIESIPLSCDADWYTTKLTLHLRNLSDAFTRETTECDEIICDDSLVKELITLSCKANWFTTKSKLRSDYFVPTPTNIMEYNEDTRNDSRVNATTLLSCEADWFTTKRLLCLQRFDKVSFVGQNAVENVTSPRVIPLSCEAQWFSSKSKLHSQAANVSQQIISKIAKTRKVTPLKCNARWFSTKPTIHSVAMHKHQVVQSSLPEKNSTLPQINCLIPSLVNLALKRAQDGNIIEQYRLLRQETIRSPVRSLKRKFSQKITSAFKLPRLSSGTYDVETNDRFKDTPVSDGRIVSDQNAWRSFLLIAHTISHDTGIIYKPEMDETTKSTSLEYISKTDDYYNLLEDSGDPSNYERNHRPIAEQQIHGDENIPLSSESDTNNEIKSINPDDSCTPPQTCGTTQFNKQFDLHIPDSITSSPQIETVSYNDVNDFDTESGKIEDKDNENIYDNIEESPAEIVGESLVEEKNPVSNLERNEMIDSKTNEDQSSDESNDESITEIYVDENSPLSLESDTNDKITSNKPDNSCSLPHSCGTIQFVQFKYHIPDSITSSSQIEKVSSIEVNDLDTERGIIEVEDKEDNYDNIEETLAEIVGEPLVEEKNPDSNLARNETIDGKTNEDQSSGESNDEQITEIHINENSPLSESGTNDEIKPDNSCSLPQTCDTIQFVQFEHHTPDSITSSSQIEKVSSIEVNDLDTERGIIEVEDKEDNYDNIEETLAEIVGEPLVEEKNPDSNLARNETIDGKTNEDQSSDESNDEQITEIHINENSPLSESGTNDEIKPDNSCSLPQTCDTIQFVQFEHHTPDSITSSSQIEKVSSIEVNDLSTNNSNIEDIHKDDKYDNLEETIAEIVGESLMETKKTDSHLEISEVNDSDNSDTNDLSYELPPNKDDNETEANDDYTKQVDVICSLESKDHVYHSTRSPTSLLDFVDDNKDQVIYIPTSNIIFLSEDEQINDLEEEIVEMASDEIVDDFVFDIATSTILDNNCTSQLLEETDLEKSLTENKEKYKQETFVEKCVDPSEAIVKNEERKQTDDLSAENIMSKYMKLIQNNSDEYQNVVEYEENGTLYIVPVVKKPPQAGFSPIKKIDEKSETFDVNEKALNSSHEIEEASCTVEIKQTCPDGDDIESKLAEIVGESLDNDNQNSVICKSISNPSADVDDIVSQLSGTDSKNTSDKIAKEKRRSKNIPRTNKTMGSKCQKIEARLDDIEILKVNIPKRTYSKITEHIMTRSRSLKRKMDMSDTKTSEKKYRKGKNIDYPKLTDASKFETMYSKEYKSLLDYCSSVKFSYALTFHKEYIDVHTLSKSWPIKETQPEPLVTPEESNEELFTELEKSEALPDPMQQTLFEEISSEFDETSYTPTNINETNFKMGFGERSGRVILETKDGESTTFSAATLSDVKQLQPLLPSDEKEKNVRTNLKNYHQDQKSNARRFVDYLNLRQKVQEFFKKSRAELYMESKQNNKKNNYESDYDWLIRDLTSTTFFRPPQVEISVNVIQVGQLPVSAAAQNPVTCDPRVTHVSNASPSQCSPENGMADELQTQIKTEYTELTTANITLPMMQEYVQHHHSSESQESSNVYSPNDNMTMSTEIKSVVKIELMEETSQEEEDENVNYENNGIQQLPNGNINTNTQYQYDNAPNNMCTESSSNQAASNSLNLPKTSGNFSDDRLSSSDTVEKSDQLAHAMNAAGIPAAKGLIKSIDTMPQNPHPNVTISQANANNFPKTTQMNALALQQALAQILPQSLNQTSSENNAQSSTNPQVLHIVQGNNTQSVINKPNGTQLLHIVQNKSVTNSNGTPTPQQSIGGLSLYDGSIQQGGNQLLHIVNTGNQKNANAGQLLKRVNLLTNLANVQGANEQKMVQFVCKSADGKSIQLPHQRSMVLRLQPLDPSAVPATSKQNENQDQSSSSGTSHTAGDKESNQNEMKSRSLYEENYAKFVQNDGKFVQNGDSKQGLEKATSLPKFNQVFGKQVYQDKPEEIESENLPQNPDPPVENNAPLEQMNDITNPPMLIRKANPPQPSHVQPNLVQQIKQTIGPMNIQTMHGGVIYTRQIPVNIGNGQTINLITVPSTELVDDSVQKQQTDAKFGNQEGDPPIIKIVPTNQPGTTTNASADDNNTQTRTSTEPSPQPNPQPQPVLTQMRIKLPMLSKAPQMVGGTRVVRPSFFQIQRNVIGGANQQVYQQLVLTAAPPLGQSIRLPAQVQKPKTPSETQSSPESQMSTSTLEQLREFDMVLEQVKERSTVQPGCSTSSTNNFSKLKSSTDTTDAPPTTSTQESPTQVLFSVGNTQPLNIVNYVTRKSTITSTTASTFARSPDSTGTVESPSSSTHSHLTHTVTSDSCASSSCASEAAAATASQPKPKKKKPKPSTSTSNPFNIKNTPKPSSQKPLEDEQTTQRILYILAEYKEQVENSPDKDKPAPRRRNNPAAPNAGSSKRKKSSSGSRRRDMSPVLGEDSCRTMGSEDSSCGTSLGECNECLETHSPEESPKKVVRRLTFEQETQITQTRTTTTTTTVPQRNVIVTDGQAFAVRGATGKPATTVLMPANYLLPVSMVKGGQQIAIVTNRGPKLLVGAGEGGTGGTLLFQRLIGPGGLKPVLARPGVRHIRLPTAALQNLQAFNIATPATASVQPPDSTASPAPAPAPPDLVDTRAMSSPWPDRDAGEVKPERGNSSPEGSEPWNLPSSSIADDYGYEEIVRTDNMDRTVLDAIPDRYSPDLEAQRIFDKMFDCDSKKSIYDSRCGYDIDASDDDKAYHQVVHRKDGRQTTRLTHVSAAALRHKYAILEHELRLQKSLSEECEDLGVDSPSASELFPEAELLFAPSPAHEQTIDQCHTPQPTIHTPSIPQPDMDDQIATDQLLTHKERQEDLDINLDDVGEIVTVGEDGMTTIPLDHEEFARSHEEFARSHPNTTFHTEPEDGEVPPFTIAQGVKGRQISFHPRVVPGTVVMAPQTTVISQATVESAGTHNTVKFSDIDNMINAMPSPQHNLNMPSVLVKDGNETLNKFDRLLNESRDINLSSNPSSVVHSTGNGTQVIRRVQYENKRDSRYMVEDSDAMIGGESKVTDERRDLQSIDDNSSSERQELFWEQTRSERKRFDFSSDSDKCCKSPFDETNSDSSGIGAHTRLDSVIKAARPERRRSDGSSAEESHPPLRTYPAKRTHQHGHHSHHLSDVDRSLTGKTRAIDRCHDVKDESKRRASNRGVVKRGCHCCNGSSTAPKPKKSRPKKSNDYPHN